MLTDASFWEDIGVKVALGILVILLVAALVLQEGEGSFPSGPKPRS